MISVANATGRFGWSSASDYLGRKNTFATFFGLGMPFVLYAEPVLGSGDTLWVY